MTKKNPTDLYETHKHKILEMSLAIQKYHGTIQIRKDSSLSDNEIAQRLELPVEVVTEIRCIAEIDLAPMEQGSD